MMRRISLPGWILLAIFVLAVAPGHCSIHLRKLPKDEGTPKVAPTPMAQSAPTAATAENAAAGNALATLLGINSADLFILNPNVQLHQADPLLTNFYDGADREKLADSLLGPLNEEDLLLYLLVKEDFFPAVYDDYMIQTDPQLKKALKDELREKINDYYYTKFSAQMDHGPELTDFEQQKLQAMIAPVVEFVWLDRVIRPQIEITPGKINLYYHSRPTEFISPHLVHVRYIFRPLDPAMTQQEEDDEEKLMDSLHDVLQQAPDKFAEAAQKYSKAPSASAGGEIPPFAAGQFFPAFEKNAFALNIPGEISPVFRSEQGLFFVQLIEHIMPVASTFAEAQMQLKKSVMKQEMSSMARYTITQMQAKAHLEARFSNWKDLRDDDMIVHMGTFVLTKAQFWKLYPSIIDFMGNVSGAELNYRSQRYIHEQLMLADLKQRGLLTDPRLARAEQLARMTLLARRVEARQLEERIPQAIASSGPTSEQVLDATLGQPLTASGQALPTVGLPRMRLFRITGEIAKPRQYDANTLASLRATLAQVLQRYLDGAQQINHSSADESVDRAGKAPAAVRGISSIKDSRFTFTWHDDGWVDLSTFPEFQNLLLNTGEGKFSPVQGTENSATTYYVAAERKLTPEEHEQMNLRMERSRTELQRDQTVERFRTGVAEQQDVNYTF